VGICPRSDSKDRGEKEMGKKFEFYSSDLETEIEEQKQKASLHV